MSISAQITTTGCIAPSYADILAQLTIEIQNIYGSDIYISPDSQDGQLLAIFAAAINDSNQAVVSTYNSYSPATAQGVGLSSAVKINGLARDVATNSQAVLTIVGVANTTITNGVVADTNSNLWNLPAIVNIPGGGSVSVTATCETAGSIFAAAGSITRIQTPTYGWQTATNPSGSTTGEPIETDAQLRIRQANSTAISANSVLSSIYAAIGNLQGVERYWIYENATASADANSAPAFSTYAVVEGGDAQEIANAIASKKTPGSPTYGTTSETVIDPHGIASTINFFVASETIITVSITIKALTGYVSSTGAAITQAIIDYINSIPANVAHVYISKLYAAVNLSGLSSTYNVTALQIAISPGSPGTSDLALTFNQVATTSAAHITLAVT